MALRCNGKGCYSAWDCDNCTQNECEKYVECDICGSDCVEEYYEIDGNDYCEDCMKENFRRIAG